MKSERMDGWNLDRDRVMDWERLNLKLKIEMEDFEGRDLCSAPCSKQSGLSGSYMKRKSCSAFASPHLRILNPCRDTNPF